MAEERKNFGRQGQLENCIRTAYGFTVSKESGSPYFLMPCPKCGERVTRKFESEQMMDRIEHDNKPRKAGIPG